MRKFICFTFTISFFVFCSYFANGVFAQEFENINFSEKYSVRSNPDVSSNIRTKDAGQKLYGKKNKNVQKTHIRLKETDKNTRIIEGRIVSTKSFRSSQGWVSPPRFLTEAVKNIFNVVEIFFIHTQLMVNHFRVNSELDIGDLSSNLSSEKSDILPESRVLGIETNGLDSVQDFLIHGKHESEDHCAGVHNSQKKYSVSSAALLLSSMLKSGPNGLYSQFICVNPQSDFIPEKARAVYKKSVTWWPQKSLLSKKIINDYVQCTAFVFMSYEMAGTPITKKGRTNADDFLAEKYTGTNGQFTKFKSGESTELPKTGDVVVWSAKSLKNQYGHVGIVVEVRTDEFLTRLKARQAGQVSKPEKTFGTIRIANANSTRVIHEYQYVIDEKTKIVSLSKVTKDWSRVPDYWLRMR